MTKDEMSLLQISQNQHQQIYSYYQAPKINTNHYNFVHGLIFIYLCINFQPYPKYLVIYTIPFCQLPMAFVTADFIK